MSRMQQSGVISATVLVGGTGRIPERRDQIVLAATCPSWSDINLDIAERIWCFDYKRSTARPSATLTTCLTGRFARCSSFSSEQLIRVTC